MTVSLVYIILHYLHARNTGMPFWIFKLQKNPKTKWGRPLAINSMLAFTALAFLSGGGQLGSRYYEWMVFIEGRKPLGYTAAAFTPWVPAFVQAWFFSITNLHATVAARGKLGSRFRGITNPLVHNFVCLRLLSFLTVNQSDIICLPKCPGIGRYTYSLRSHDFGTRPGDGSC